MSDTRDDQRPEAAGKAAGNSERKDNVDSPSAAPVRKPVWLHIFGHDITAPFLLLLLSLALFVSGQWTVPPLDRDEPRFTQATKQMLETNDYIDIRFQDQALVFEF